MKKDFNKTAIQELIDEMDLIKNELWKEGLISRSAMIGDMIRKAVDKLEKEKDQLNVSFISGCIEALSYHTPVRDRIKEGYFEDKAEQYFNYTYNKNDNETNF
jgi:hypothetical protein